MKHSLLRFFLAVAPCAAIVSAQDGGPPFQVNTFTRNNQRQPAISADTSGRFVVAWASQTQDAADYAVIARAYEANAAPRTGEVQGNLLVTLGPQFEPAVAALPDGGWFVAWTEGFLAAQNVWIRRFGANGTPVLGSEQQVNPPLVFGDQHAPSLDADALGNVVVVWASQNGFGSTNWTIFAKRYSSAGVPISGDITVSQTATGDQQRPVVALDPAGNFVVAWQAFGRDGSGNAVLARRFDAAGNPQGGEFLVNQFTAGAQERPWVDRDAQGRFVITWQSEGQDGSLSGIYMRRFDAAGVALANEVKVNATTHWFQQRPVVSMVPDGRFIIVWQSGHEGDFGVFGQRYDAQGTPVGGEFRVPTAVAGHQFEPTVTAQPSGGFVVAWMQTEPGSATMESCCFDVWARAYPAFGAGSSDLIFEDGFETGDLSRWSAVSTDGDDLRVTREAALVGAFGLQANVDDTASLFVQDATPSDEPRYRARFYFDPNGFDPGEAQGAFRTRIFIAFEENPTRRLVAIVLRRQGGQYAVMARVRQDNGSLRDTGFFPISNDRHWIEFDWRRASADNSLDGRFDLWIDGSMVSSLTGLDTFVSTVDFARMGALSVKAGASGMLLFDAFESRRLNAIGSE